MIVEKAYPSGAWVISDTIEGEAVTQTYFFYTKREAIRLFKQDLRGK